MSIGKRIAEQAVDYLVPVICAAAMVWFGKFPEGVRHWVPVGIVGILAMCAVIQCSRTHKEIAKLRALHEDDGLRLEATRAQLDDAMGRIYTTCVERGYSTEDERRCYERMEKAYEGIGGNGEAKRRAASFFAIKREEVWLHEQH